MDSFSFAKVKSLLPTPPKLPNMPSLSNLPFQVPHLSGTSTPPPEAAMNEKHFTRGAPALNKELPRVMEPRPIDDEDVRPKSNLDLISECDNFPYLHAAPERFLRQTNHYYHLQVREYPGLCLGYVVPEVAAVFDGLDGWWVDEEERRLVLAGGDTEEQRSEVVATTFAAMRSLNHFRVLKGWRDELYTVHGPGREVLFKIERAASALLGVVTYGAHMTAYVRTAKHAPSQTTSTEQGDNKSNDKGKSVDTGASTSRQQSELKIWVPRRARTKETYPGMLDNTVAGGLAAGEQPLECLIREAQEEASLPAHVLRERLRAAGTVSYFHVRDRRAGGEIGLLQPEVQYVYDLDLSGLEDEVAPKPEDGEVEEFLLMGIEEVRAVMSRGEFKPNTALVLLDFFVRHGIVTAENESDYAEITSRLHRVTDFPMR